MKDDYLFVVIAYDIANDRRRLRVMKILKGYGEHVQESVFECHLRRSTFQEMLRRLKRSINLKQDNVRFYHLCRADIDRIQQLGVGQPVRLQQEYQII